MRLDFRLDFRRVNVVAARLEHVVNLATQRQIAALVQDTDIAGPVPHIACDEFRSLLRAIPVPIPAIGSADLLPSGLTSPHSSVDPLHDTMVARGQTSPTRNP